MSRTFILLLLLLISFSCCHNEEYQSPKQENGSIYQTYTQAEPLPVFDVKPIIGDKAKNIIIMIGDGMSLNHIAAAWTANHGKLNVESCTYTGLSKTYCLDKLITDSAAGGSAIATGQKIQYHAVAVSPDGQPLSTIMDDAAVRGKSTGIVASCRLWDATPADFACHSLDREDDDALFLGFLDSEIDYIVGGGSVKFENRADGRDLPAEFQAKGYQTPLSWDELEKIEQGRVFGAIYPRNVPLPAERGDILAKTSLKGLDLLSQNEKGFIMMIEGSQLDDYGHSNELDLLMQEVLDFDHTVGRVLQWAEKNEETLVIVTADHETGGLTLVGGDQTKGEVVAHFSTNEHSGVMVPVYAYGPGAQNFSGIYNNSDIRNKILSLLY